MTIDTRISTNNPKRNYGGFVYQRNEDDQFLYIIERWNGEPNDVKDLQTPFTHRQNLEQAVDAYNLKVKQKEKALMENVSITIATTGNLNV